MGAKPGLDDATRITLTGLLRRFIEGDHSRECAGEIEVAFERVFGETEPWGTFVHKLASYSPGGGEYLYDEEAIAASCRRILALLWGRDPTDAA